MCLFVYVSAFRRRSMMVSFLQHRLGAREFLPHRLALLRIHLSLLQLALAIHLVAASSEVEMLSVPAPSRTVTRGKGSVRALRGKR